MRHTSDRSWQLLQGEMSRIKPSSPCEVRIIRASEMLKPMPILEDWLEPEGDGFEEAATGI